MSLFLVSCSLKAAAACEWRLHASSDRTDLSFITSKTNTFPKMFSCEKFGFFQKKKKKASYKWILQQFLSILLRSLFIKKNQIIFKKNKYVILSWRQTFLHLIDFFETVNAFLFCSYLFRIYHNNILFLLFTHKAYDTVVS